VLLVFGVPCQLRLLAGLEHGRTIPLADMSYDAAYGTGRVCASAVWRDGHSLPKRLHSSEEIEV
jgi:hypothetical protein